MNQDTYDKGREIRATVLGEAYVAKAMANADDFSGPLQDLVTEYCWGAVWGRDGLPLKTRSMLNLAMLAVLNRPNELKTHVKGALTNGVTREEIRGPADARPRVRHGDRTFLRPMPSSGRIVLNGDLHTL